MGPGGGEAERSEKIVKIAEDSEGGNGKSVVGEMDAGKPETSGTHGAGGQGGV